MEPACHLVFECTLGMEFLRTEPSKTFQSSILEKGLKQHHSYHILLVKAVTRPAQTHGVGK